INCQESPRLHLAGRVAKFEGELNYHLPERFRTHAERVNLGTRLLGSPLHTARLLNVLMGFFDKIPHLRAKQRSFATHPLKPVISTSDSSGGNAIENGPGNGQGNGPDGQGNGPDGQRNGPDGQGNGANGQGSGSSVSEESGSGESDWAVQLRCHGPPCPAFGSCTARFPNVQACWNPHLVDEPEDDIAPPINCHVRRNRTRQERWPLFDETCSHRQDFTPHGATTLQMVRLEDVFLTDNGFNLNRSHLFVRNGCPRFLGA
ncbi:unnamed protein product, partial [Closterium sp. Naga37s-1]